MDARTSFAVLWLLASARLGALADIPFLPVRLPAKPAWETALAPLLERLPENVQSPGDAALAPGVPYQEAMTRKQRLARLGHQGETVWWRARVALPPTARDRPAVLEAEESRVITGAWLDGVPLPSPDRAGQGDLRGSGEGVILLPLTARHPEGTLILRAVELPHLYADGFGPLRLRPAELGELVSIDPPDRGFVTVRNRGPLPLALALRTRHEDFFGSPLASREEVFTLPPGAAHPAMLGAPEDTDLYKTRIWATAGEQRTPEYWDRRESGRITRNRPEVVRLTQGWEWTFAPAPHGGVPDDAAGWHEAAMNFPPKGAEYASHWVWLRQRFVVPANWVAGCRVALRLPDHFRMHARFFVDGREIAAGGFWDFPAVALLPPDLQPGGAHTLQVALTDYIAGLAPGVQPPARGPFQTPARGIASPVGPISPLGISFSMQPELFAVPAARVDWAGINPRVAGGCRLEIEADIANDSESPITGQVRATVRVAGNTVLVLPPQPVSLAAGARTTLSFAPAWPAAPRWTPDTPQLCELRLELIGADGNTLDVFRERFGFREWGMRDGCFTLNGDRIKLLGGSHVPLAALSWPVRGHSYRLLRFSGPSGLGWGGAGLAGGINALTMGDEAGYLFEAQPGPFGAHGEDGLAWDLPETWDRLAAWHRAAWHAFPNHPSIFAWDTGNELAFRSVREAAGMSNLFARIRGFDPTRFVFSGGANRFSPADTILNFHGWGMWDSRADFYFHRPEERPPWLREGGFYQRAAVYEPASNWHAALSEPRGPGALDPGVTPELLHAGGRPVVFSEGHYYEGADALFGHDAWLTVPGPSVRLEERLPFQSVERAFQGAECFNVLATRQRSLQHVRQGGAAASMIHIDRGVGRFSLPLMSASWDGRRRFASGERLRTRFSVHNDLTDQAVRPVAATYRLLKEDVLLGEQRQTLTLPAGGIGFVDLDLPLPEANTEDIGLRLEIRVSPEDGPGEFRDELPITVFAPSTVSLPKGCTLSVFDPANAIVPILTRSGVPFARLDDLTAWKASGRDTLLAGPEALMKAPPAALADLGRKISGGGQAVILAHASLPRFLRAALTQAPGYGLNAARLDGPSPVTAGLLTEDFREWRTGENDQVAVWSPLDEPFAGNFRTHVTAGRGAPVLEVGEGAGRVLFVQLNLAGACGLDPAADRVFANVLAWTGQSSPFGARRTLVVGRAGALGETLRERLGLDAAVIFQPTNEQLAAADLLVAGGEGGALPDAATLAARVRRGATLLVCGLDAAGASVLSQITGTPVEAAGFPHRHAYVAAPDSPLMNGLGHADFFPGGSFGDDFDPASPLPPDARGLIAKINVRGPGVHALTRPACLAEIPAGQGRVIIDTIPFVDQPVPARLRVVDQLLNNAGARLDPAAHREDQRGWTFRPVDLARFVNWPLRDGEKPGERRGWNVSGPRNDLRLFPTGRQTFRGVEYAITPPEDAGGNAIIAVAGKTPKLPGLPTEVRGIPVHAAADRLYFLHVAVWGVPKLVYRVYYEEDRRTWIPGRPDPFVDITVKPREAIDDWVTAGKVESSERFMPGAQAAWVGRTIETQENGGRPHVGVFAMPWDNPHPEKTIESIDILSPGDEGSGSVFVFAITAATRSGSPFHE